MIIWITVGVVCWTLLIALALSLCIVGGRADDMAAAARGEDE